MPSITKEFEDFCWELLKDLWTNQEEIIFPQSDLSSVSHYLSGLFPSISVELPFNFFEYVSERKQKNKGKGSWAHLPDFCVLKKKYISKIRINKQPWTKFNNNNEIDSFFKEYHLDSTRFDWWILSEELDLDWNSLKGSNHILVLKEKAMASKIIDAKYYTSKEIRKDQITKLKIDASLFGSDECYLITFDDISLPTNSKFIPIKRFSDNKFKGTHRKVILYKIDDYQKPNLIGRTEFRLKYEQKINELFK